MSVWRLATILCFLLAASHSTTGQDPVTADSNATLGRPPLHVALDQLLDAVLDVVAPVSPALGDSPCRQHGLLYRRAVKEGQPWALRMIDAGAKIPSGLLSLNLIQLGDFDECVRVRHVDPEVGVIEGQHCLVSVGVRDALSELTVIDKAMLGALNESYHQRFSALLEQAGPLAAFQTVGATWAVCVPAACSAAEVQLHLRSALPNVELRVDEHACASNADEVPPWDWQAVLAVVLLSVLFLLLVVGTIYDLWTTDDGAKSHTVPKNVNTSQEPATLPRLHPLVAFSLYFTGRHFFGADAPAGDSLASLNGIRCIATLGVVLAHHYLFAVIRPVTNLAETVAGLPSWSHVHITNASLYVDTFLVLSGTLLAYNYIGQRERKTEFSLRRFYLSRYFRVAPAHFVMMLLGVASGQLIVYLGANGPVVKPNVAQFEQCSTLRWLSLLYIGNYVTQDHFCLGSAWYLNIEMQLLWLSPLVLYPLWRKPRLGLTLLGLLSAAGVGWVFSIAYEHRLQAVSVFHESLASGNLAHVYFFTHTRCVPWFFGLAVGALLSRRVAPSRRQAALGWCACVALVYYCLVHSHAGFQHDFVSDRLNSAIYFTLMRPAWGLVIAWIVFACETGTGGFLNTFLGWRGWRLLSRLSYGVLLFHYVLVSTITGTVRTGAHLTEISLIIEYWGVVVLSMFAGTVQHLAVEMPFFILYHMYQADADNKKRLKKTS